MNNGFFSQVRQRLDILSTVQRFVQLKRKGKEYLGLCPFHGEKTPSFTVNVQKGFYHCFGCTAHGDAIQFLSLMEGLSYKAAAVKVAKEYGIPLPERKNNDEEADYLYKVLDAANTFFKTQTNKGSIEYLHKRGISDFEVEKFSIGYAPGQNSLINYLESRKIKLEIAQKAGLLATGDSGSLYEVLRKRITFPIFDSQGLIVGFGGRIIGSGIPKYLNSPETAIFKKSSVLFGENLAMDRAYKTNQMVLAEGYFDVIALHSAGIENAVGTLGTAITKQHLEKAWRYVDEIVLCLDGDSAGSKATLRSVEIAAAYLSTQKHLSIMQMPEGKDPDQAKQSGIDLVKLLECRLDLSQWLWNYFWKLRTSDSPEQKARVEQKFKQYADTVGDKVLRRHYHQFAREQSIASKKGKGAGIRPEKLPCRAANQDALDNLENALLEVLEETPQILKQETVADSLSRLTIASQHIEKRLAQLLNQPGIDGDDLSSARNSSRVKSVLLICKRHQLETLKLEYLKLLATPSENPKERVDVYLKEMNKLNDEIRGLIET